jgi:hypothetical protein
MYPIEVWWYLSAKNPELFKNNKAAQKKPTVSAEEMMKLMETHDEVRT